MMARMRIATCRAEDVALLDRHLPSPSATSYHAQRYAAQVAGRSTFLVVWVDDRPVATGEIRWDGCRAPEVRAVVPDCPEINGLEVVEALRSQGIGTALVRHAEHLAAARGVRTIGLGVGDYNHRAAALYARLGYLPRVPYLDRYTYTDDAGVEHPVEDACVFLSKELS